MRPDTRFVLAVPEIEVWLGQTGFKRNRVLSLLKLDTEIKELQSKLEERARKIPSLQEFIEALRSFEKSAEGKRKLGTHPH